MDVPGLGLGEEPVLFTKHREKRGCLRTSVDVAKKVRGGEIVPLIVEFWWG